ncbi:MAG: CZB domain-containing protein [Chromatiales bacterium]|nr:CZB domain-containing protein [Chromatiales bacterium]
MNIYMKAIQDHTDWKVRIKGMIDGKRVGHFNLHEVSSEDQCELGRWISAMDKRLGHTYALSRLRNFHREFHTVAGEAVRHAQHGEMAQAQAILDGEYARLSREVVKSLLAMSKRGHHDE